MLKDTYSSSMGAGLPNPNLQPEHSRNWNAGYSHSLGRRTLLQATLFRSDLRNAIESVYVTDPGGFCPNSKIVGYCSEMANIGREVHEGEEIELRSSPLAWLTVATSYGYLNRTIAYNFIDFANVSQRNTSVITLPTLPKNKLEGTVAARLLPLDKGRANGQFRGASTSGWIAPSGGRSDGA